MKTTVLKFAEWLIRKLIGEVAFDLIIQLVKDVESEFENQAIPDYIMTELSKLPERARKMEYAWKLIETRYESIRKLLDKGFVSKDIINLIISLVVARFNSIGLFKHK